MKTSIRAVIAVVVVGLVLFIALRDSSEPPAGAHQPAGGGTAKPLGLSPGTPGNAAEGVVLGPVHVDMRALPLNDPASLAKGRPSREEDDENRIESPLSEEEAEALREEALRIPPQPNIQVAVEGRSPTAAPSIGVSFDSMNFDDDPRFVPPDSQMAVGPSHIIGVVNSSIEVYNKSGTTLAGPVTFDSFFTGITGCTGTFDPNVLYDEEANRFFLGVDGCDQTNCQNNRYCMAVSQTPDPTGSWWAYSFDASVNSGEFFDYPHAGVGDEAIFMAGNTFLGQNFTHADVFAINKAIMYAGGALPAPVRKGFPSTAFTPQPMNAHGFGQGTWPTGNVHYVIIDNVFDGSSMGVYRWTDPFGANTFTLLGTVNLNAGTGVVGGFPIEAPQTGTTRRIAGNDWRPLDLEYRNGRLFMSHTIACNPGGGTVNCSRWAEIDPAAGGGPAFVQGGVLASNGDHRIFTDIAANHCNDVAIGYTKTNTSINPAVFFTGRLGSEPFGTLQPEAQLKAGEVIYTSFEPPPPPPKPPLRWGDYSGMTSDPDGKTFWYMGEFSRNNTSFTKWGNRIASLTTSCNPPAPTVTLTQPSSPTMLQFCGPVSLAGTGITPGSVLKLFLSTSGGPLDLVANGVSPGGTSTTTWTGNLPCPFPAPNQFMLGQGFLGLQLVRTDAGFTSSNVVGIPLIGNAGQGVPSILAIGGTLISTTSWQPSIGLANVEQVLLNNNSTVYRIDGTGFTNAVVNVFTSSGNCGPLAPTAQSSTTIDFKIPASCPTGPGSFQVVNATGNFRTSNAVSAPVGAAMNISTIGINANTVTVTGTGFSTLTVINLFASNGSTVVNFGGFNGGGQPNIPLNFVNSTQFTFTRPGGAVAGPAFVEAINPPFIPFAGSGNDPQGAFNLP